MNNHSQQANALVVERFSVRVWFTFLFAISFSGAVFGVYGFAASLAMFIFAWLSAFATLWWSYQKRQQKDALKVPADALAMVGLIFFIIALINNDIVIALIEMLFFLQLSLNLYFRQHRQSFFGLVACFIALMSGAVNTFDTSYLLFILLYGVFACFYVAECHIDKRLGLMSASTQSSNHDDTTRTVVNNATTKWSLRSRFGLVASILVVASLIYLIFPRFPAGDLGNSPLKGWGKYDNDFFSKNLLNQETDLSDKFYNTPEENPDNDGQTNQVNTNEDENTFADNQKNTDAPDDNDTDSLIDQLSDIFTNEQENTQAEQMGGNADSNSSNAEQSNNSNHAYLWDKSVYFYIKTNRPRYYQVQTKTYFDGKSWHALQYAHKHIPISRDKSKLALYPAKPNQNVDITVAKDIPTNIISTDNTVAIRFPSNDVGRDYYDGLKTTKNLKKDTFYQLQVLDEYKHNRLVDRYQAPPDDKDLQLPTNLDPRIAMLAEEVILGNKSDWQKALRLETHMRTRYQYSLATLSNQNNIPVVDFLFGHKTGHCEYFATSLALLLRTQGIPARMVTGFVGEDYNPVTGYYEVKGINGHAWVEAYIDGVWVTLEGTGAYNQPEQEPTPDPQHPNQSSSNGLEQPDQQNSQNYDDNNEHNTHSELKEYLEHLKNQRDLLDNEQPQSFSDSVSNRIKDISYNLLVLLQQLWQFLQSIAWYLLLGFMMLVLFWKVSTLTVVKQKISHVKKQRYCKKQQQQLKKYQPSEAKADTHFYLSLLQDISSKLGIQRPAGMSAEVYSQRLFSADLLSAEQANFIGTLVDESYYQTHADNKDAVALKAEFLAVLSELHTSYLNGYKI